MNNTEIRSQIEDEVSLKAIASVVAGGWIIILISAVIGISLALYITSGKPRLYQASAVIMPVSNNSSSSGLGSLGGLKFLSKSSKPDSFRNFLDIIETIRLAKRLDDRYGLLAEFTAPMWKKNPDGTWAMRNPPGTIRKMTGGLKSLLGLPPLSPPELADLRDTLKDRVQIVEKEQGNNVLISANMESPEKAERLLSIVLREGESLLREEEAESLQAQINYITAKINNTTSIDHRAALTSMLIEQEQKQMMVSSDIPFSFKILDDISSSSHPVSPKPAMNVMIGLLLGIFAGIVITVSRHAILGTGTGDKKTEENSGKKYPLFTRGE